MTLKQIVDQRVSNLYQTELKLNGYHIVVLIQQNWQLDYIVYTKYSLSIAYCTVYRAPNTQYSN